MSYPDNSDVGRNRSNRINHQLLTLRVQVGTGLIKQQDRKSIQQRTRNGQPLALPARKRSALLADISIESFGKICHNLLETHLTQHATMSSSDAQEAPTVMLSRIVPGTT